MSLLVYSHRYSRKKEFTKGSAGGGAPLRELFEIHSICFLFNCLLLYHLLKYFATLIFFIGDFCKCQAFFTIFSQYFYCILVYYKCSLLCDLKPVFCWYCSKIHIELQHKKTGICQSFKNYYSIAFIQINSFISSRYNCLDDL